VSEPRPISVWYGNGFYLKTFRDGDGFYYTVSSSPDFATLEQVEKYNEALTDFARRYPNG
jgi:hypothetical protein